jgi:hypothetical protein
MILSFLASALYGMSGQRHAPAALYSRERTPVPIGQEAGWASELVWTQRLEEKSFGLCRGSSPVRPVCNQTLLTELPHYYFWVVAQCICRLHFGRFGYSYRLEIQSKVTYLALI